VTILVATPENGFAARPNGTAWSWGFGLRGTLGDCSGELSRDTPARIHWHG
jgi:hypothetical protein